MREARNTYPKRQRLFCFAAGACALALLAASLWFASLAHSGLSAAMAELDEARRMENESARLRREYANWRVWREELMAFQKGLEDVRLSPAAWRVRELTVDRAKLPREKVQAYLSSLSGAEGYLFLPERFEVKVLYDTDDLLRWRPGSTNELELTLMGDYYIRSEP